MVESVSHNGVGRELFLLGEAIFWLFKSGQTE